MNSTESQRFRKISNTHIYDNDLCLIYCWKWCSALKLNNFITCKTNWKNWQDALRSCVKLNNLIQLNFFYISSQIFSKLLSYNCLRYLLSLKIYVAYVPTSPFYLAREEELSRVHSGVVPSWKTSALRLSTLFHCSPRISQNWSKSLSYLLL